MPRPLVELPPRCPPTLSTPVQAVRRMLPADGWIPTHAHAWGQLAYPTTGAVRLDVPGSRWLVPPYRAVWVPPHVEHELLLLGKVWLRTLHVVADRAPLPLDRCVLIEISPLVRELIDALAADPPPCEGRRAPMEALLLAELGHARALDLSLPRAADRRLRTLCDELMDNPADNTPLTAWAKRVGASPRTLARLFQEELGMPFGQWRQQVRLMHATVLVAHGKPFADIANQLGYASPSAFSAMFRRALGMSPRDFFAEHGTASARGE